MAASPRPPSRALGLAVLLAGFGLLVVAQLVRPSGALPLYDGVIISDPFRYLDPPPGQLGDPTSASEGVAIRGGRVQDVEAATQENPPQAQLFSNAGVFSAPSGATKVIITITPVEPVVPPAKGHVDGNVYRFAAAADTGAASTIVAGTTATIALRGPSEVPKATIEHFDGTGWVVFRTQDAGIQSMWLANVTQLGDYALVAPGAPPVTPGESSGPNPSGAPATGNPGGSPTASLPSSTSAGATPAPSGSPSVVPPPGGGSSSGGGLGTPVVIVLTVGVLVVAGAVVALRRRR